MLELLAKPLNLCLQIKKDMLSKKGQCFTFRQLRQLLYLDNSYYKMCLLDYLLDSYLILLEGKTTHTRVALEE